MTIFRFFQDGGSKMAAVRHLGPFPSLWLLAFTTACTTVQAVIRCTSTCMDAGTDTLPGVLCIHQRRDRDEAAERDYME